MDRKWLPQEGLKWIACLSMLLDHLGACFFPEATALRVIGRLAFPLYGFLLTEGLRHTHSRKGYLLRLGLLALLSELPFDLLFWGRPDLRGQNVMVTLLLGALACVLLDEARKPWQIMAGLAVIFVAARFAGADFGCYGVGLILLLRLTRELPHRTLLRGLGMALLAFCNAGRLVLFGLSVPAQLLTLPALIPIELYNGKKQTRSKAVRWCFNLFYPAHLTVLWLLFRVL